MSDCWYETILTLLEKASTDLPPDVEAALRRGLTAEIPGSNAAGALEAILENVDLARHRRQPLCQDTGTLLFHIDFPVGFPLTALRKALEKAVVEATRQGILRQNCVDSLSGRNRGNNLGPGAPQIHLAEHDGETVRLALMLKGGGSENVGMQFALPDSVLQAGRDLAGVRRCLLQAVHRAQGQGCAPGILGVCIGGDRSSGYAESKRQLLRPLDQRSAVPELANLEEQVLREANQLGIGPMGFGGQTTLLGVAIGALDRVPASYFVTVSYMCWACRRQQLEAQPDGRLLRWF